MPEDTHYDEMKGILFRGATATALDFNTRVTEWIMLCRVNDGGIPAFRCYDSETEVLTEDGWKHFDKVEFNDKIATLNPETGMLEHQHPTNIINVLYKGKMYRIHTDYVDLMVTPTHNMFVARARSKRISRRKVFLPRKKWIFELIPAEKSFGKHVLYKRSCKWNGKNQDYFILPSTPRYGEHSLSKIPEKKIPMDEWLMFFGFWLAEGSLNKNRRSYNVQLSNSDKVYLKSIKNLLQSWGFHVIIQRDRKSWQLRVSSKQLYHYLKQFGESYEKYVPKEIKALSRGHLKVLLESYLKGDGTFSDHYVGCYTSSEKLRDDLQEIALKIGISANYYLHTLANSKLRIDCINREITARHNNWAIIFVRKYNLPRVYATRARNENQKRFIEEWVGYDGMVGCVGVPNHIIYVRRNGKPVWCGNTGFARRPFKADDEYYVMGVCWLGANLVRSQWFRGVSEEDWEYMRDNSDDYQYLLKKYGKPGMLERTVKAPVVVV